MAKLPRKVKLIGTNGDETLTGAELDDNLQGGGGNDTLVGGAGDDFLAGGDGADALLGGAGRDRLIGGRGNDKLAGGAGADDLAGQIGNDSLWGAEGDDLLDGAEGNDLLVGGFGSDQMRGGVGADVLLSRSDTGEPVPAQGGDRVFADIVIAGGDDTLTGGAGADTFRFELLMNARPEIAAAHVVNNHIDWHAVAGENGAVHDHWVDGIGNDLVTDFRRAQGDKIQVAGHTVKAEVTQVDGNGDGVADYSVIRLYSDQGATGAHNKDELGTITVRGDLITAADISVDSGAHYGAYGHPGDGPYTWDDTGVLVGGAGLGHADHLMA